MLRVGMGIGALMALVLVLGGSAAAHPERHAFFPDGSTGAVPISEHAPDLVLHGHAHAGTFSGRVGEVPVYNVSVPVMGEDWWEFELTGDPRIPSEVR